MDHSLAVDVKHHSFKYEQEQVLNDVTFSLPTGARCLVIGANGAGKSTLLRIIAGKHMHPREAVTVLGKAAFFETSNKVAYLGSDWRRSVSCVGNSVPFHGDIPVSQMIKVVDTDDLERKNHLIQLLGVKMNWKMHKISDGEVRRVQILMALMRPFDLLLLDEITVDLDVLTRMNLLNFFKEEAARGCTVMYATHIFDGIDGWPTHVLRIREGQVELFEPSTLKTPFYLQAAEWLQEEQDARDKAQAL